MGIDPISYGRMPEWPNGTGCKPVALTGYGGSNPSPPIALFFLGFQNETHSLMTVSHDHDAGVVQR
jgi:hypothetical protein